ncbi:HD-GYP domain-containing protein [Brachyspira sp.]|uniref:HD-GYP domain-containing protein n=1 Tax=Brachyspira sp. TaxID=1977261 RepID=UPI003D7E12EA
MENFAKIKTQDIKSQPERKDIYLDNDFIAISKYIEVKDEDINRLKKWDITEVFIKDLESEGATHNSVQDFDKFLREYKVFKNIYLNIIKQTKNNLGNFRHNNLVNMKELNEIIDGLLDIMNRNLNSFIALLSIFNFNKEDFYYVRSLNVAIISLIIGKGMKLSDGILKKLGLGAILYDIGLVKVPEKILNKQYKHTPEEYAEIKKHTVYGYKLMKSNFRFEEEMAAIALEHHEYFNGKGYPRGISGNEIHLYAKIVAIAHEAEKVMKNNRILSDEKNLSSDKKNVEKKLLFDSVKLIMQGANNKYDPTVSKVFIGIFNVYPVGSVIILNDKRKALVFATNNNFPIRPIIKIMSDENGNFTENGEVINLVENNQIFISGIDRDDKFLEEVNKKILNKE